MYYRMTAAGLAATVYAVVWIIGSNNGAIHSSATMII